VRKSEKQEVIANLQNALESAAGLILSGYRGLTVKDMMELRRAVTAAGGEMRVVKKTLFFRAVEGRNEAAVKEYMDGPVAVTFVSGDTVAVMKAMDAFAGTHDELEFKGGWIEGDAFDANQMMVIAKLPPREELLARFMASLQSPLVKLIGVLQAVPRDLVLTLQAVAEKQSGEAPAGA